MKKSLVDVGVVTSTKGLKGHVKIKPFIEKELFLSLDQVVISPSLKSRTSLGIENSQESGKDRVVVKFVEINSPEEAAQIRGRFLQKPIDDLPKNYYKREELKEMDVFSKEGKRLGRILEVEESPAGDFFVMKNKGTVRFSASKNVVLEIDLKNKKMVVDLPEGIASHED